jgi:hypothetical protein
MRKLFCTALVCFFGTMAFGQTPLLATMHATSSAEEWIRETVQLVEARRLAYEARQLEFRAVTYISALEDDHPIHLQVKQGVPTAREPKWPSIPKMAIPKVGETEIRPGTLREQRSQVNSRLAHPH